MNTCQTWKRPPVTLVIAISTKGTRATTTKYLHLSGDWLTATSWLIGLFKTKVTGLVESSRRTSLTIALKVKKKSTGFLFGKWKVRLKILLKVMCWDLFLRLGFVPNWPHYNRRAILVALNQFLQGLQMGFQKFIIEVTAGDYTNELCYIREK